MSIIFHGDKIGWEHHLSFISFYSFVDLLRSTSSAVWNCHSAPKIKQKLLAKLPIFFQLLSLFIHLENP